VTERDRTPEVVVSEIGRLAARTGAMLRGRVTGLQIELRGGGVVLLGTASSFYAKQLAQHAVMSGTDLPIVRNEIEVIWGADPEPHRGSRDRNVSDPA
jgi:hypothetical protein